MTAPLDLLESQSWRQAFFTTYALSLSFFEGIVLDALVRSNSRECTILSDVAGVKGALSEKGAFHAGRDYQVEPVSVSTGVFHPKVNVLLGEDNDAHLLVGSGNLTFGGWGANLEVVEHLHPSFAADAFDDAALFFEKLIQSPRIQHSADVQCMKVADGLRRSTTGKERSGRFRFISNVDRAIADQIAEFAGELGGATRVICAAPFWEPAGPSVLAQALQVKKLLLHVHEEVVRGRLGLSWPWGATILVEPVYLEYFRGAQKVRKLHAKVIEVMCKRGRLIVSGSSNGTSAALGTGQNIEACIVRLEAGNVSGWEYVEADAPIRADDGEAETDASDDSVGVLRAELRGPTLVGRVLTPHISGEAKVIWESALGETALGVAILDKRCQFQLRSEVLEREVWSGSLLLIKVVATDGRSAVGFVSCPEISQLKRRAGMIAPKIIALIRGMETPEDVTAVMLWFQENPERLLGIERSISGSSSQGNEEDDSEATILVSQLRETTEFASPHGTSAESHTGWKAFIDRLFAALREPRGPLRGTGEQHFQDENATTDDDPDSIEETQRQIDRSFEVFEALLGHMLSADNGGRFALCALDLAEYVCRRLEPPEQTRRRWLKNVIRGLCSCSVPAERMADVAAAVLALHLLERSEADITVTRQRLLNAGIVFDPIPPQMEFARGFDFDGFEPGAIVSLWIAAGTTRTVREEVRAYIAAARNGNMTSSDYPALRDYAGSAWSALEKFLQGEDDGRVTIVPTATRCCPHHTFIVLPDPEYHGLVESGIGITHWCCNSILLREDA